jgi:RNA polymerase sigma-70 factor (ECF subfamily)
MGNTETAALNALMLFNAARLKARFGPAGELLDLEEQNRSLWNPGLIRLAFEFLMQSRGERISSYHYEASIACLHCAAKSFESTNWKAITDLYRKLLKLGPNPFVGLNYAIALFYSGEKQEAFKIVNDLQRNTFLNQYYLLNATLGKMYFLEGEHQRARDYYMKTLAQTNFQVEKDYIKKMIRRIDSIQ